MWKTLSCSFVLRILDIDDPKISQKNDVFGVLTLMYSWETSTTLLATFKDTAWFLYVRQPCQK